MDIKGLAAVVTGAGSGLGEATARALAGAGARVALLDIHLDRAAGVAAEIGGIAIRCDVADARSAADALQDAHDVHGAARVVVNCAGVAPAAKIVGRHGPHDLAAFTKTITVNLVGTFNIMRLAAADMQSLPALATTERGVIINTASIAAFEGQIGQAAYAASKGGVVAMTLPAARELAASGIRVLAIAPGLFATPLLAGLADDVQQKLGDQIPFPARLGAPAEFAKLVLHMVDNVMLNGEVVRLDGAFRMPPK
ncbi:MAG: SDR family NAD(P)-dependent oxidoreductase [Rhodospirillales bacterium]|nr:SDR family NAD(P)-dependent oxidoreductase [Rhodospirillales bacterium]